MSAITVRTPAWLDDAICASTDPALFMPDQGESPKPAQHICAQCTVATQCLAWAVDNEIPHGIYGGVTARDRQIMRRAVA